MIRAEHGIQGQGNEKFCLMIEGFSGKSSFRNLDNCFVQGIITVFIFLDKMRNFFFDCNKPRFSLDLTATGAIK